jgi:GABA(A) receptor-associated protein
MPEKVEIQRLLAKYPDKIPIFLDIAPRSSVVLDKHKYLVPREYTLGQFMYMLRKRIKLPATKAIFLFIGSTILCSSETMESIHIKYKDSNGSVNITVSEENTFGFEINLNI